MAKKRLHWPGRRTVTVCIIAGILALGGTAAAGTATLTITPGGSVKAGETLHFSGTVPYMDPAVLSVDRQGAVWSSEDVKVSYPTKGQPANVSFTKVFAVPQDAKPGNSFCFILKRNRLAEPKKDPLTDPVCVSVKALQAVQPGVLKVVPAAKNIPGPAGSGQGK